MCSTTPRVDDLEKGYREMIYGIVKGFIGCEVWWFCVSNCRSIVVL